MDATLHLNDAQRRAVEHGPGALLVIAGAGSGKTRVLTARVARLLEEGVPPDAILAFTFTNRAAREMRSRIEREVGAVAARVWIGTFHATGVRILRRTARRAQGETGIPPNFTIYDREDQESLVREILKTLAVPEGTLRVGQVLSRISDAKNALVTPDQALHAAVGPSERRFAECFAAYQRGLRERSALDFDDLIGEVVRLFRNHPEIAEHYGRRFQHVLVDEYQDTNHAQFRLVAALASVHGNLFVVGDDDQSIYGFRGADLTHVLDFEQAFSGAAVVRLEQNYRSTRTILGAANAVIANNRARKGKTLWSDREDGRPLRFVLAQDDADEARRVRGFLAERQRRGLRLDGTAVLYRTHAQSRAIETELRQHGMPYEIVGGVSFYQRREVKDLLAYLRMAVNPSDAVAFWRVWNTPRRGLGEVVRAAIEARLSALGATPEQALRELSSAGELHRTARAGAQALLALLDELRAHLDEPVDALLARVLQRTDYLGALGEPGERDVDERRANLEELLAGAAQFAAAHAEGDTRAFLAEAALLTDVDRLAEGADRVLLLTAHNAKGLEFDAVAIAGLEEGLFPHGSSLDDPTELEEERRLFYVALTRARDDVLLTAAAYRRRFDGSGGAGVSRFVDEIPPELLEREVPPPRPAWRPSRAITTVATALAPAYRTRGALARLVGREVYHESFGRGVVM
ncbi:MAG TPA: UvrD-helicase domain-containing protein, partial [Candidatus Limnocylindria bacterium]|nr:UvrD-helicase domain-containing protein [Candidatus Limnocylindria bacterium]